MKPDRWISRKLSIVVTCLLMAILVATMPVEAVNYTINKIYSSPNFIEPINGINYRHRTINNAGQIAWIEICEGGLAVYLREPNGNIQQISNMMTNSPFYIRLSINDRGQVVWTTQQDGYPSGIYLSDPNSRATPITITQSTQSVYYEYYINKIGQVAWKTWDDNGPIYLYDNGSSVLVPNSSIVGYWDFNNKGEIVWQGKDNVGIEGIYLYKNGASSRIINDWRYTPVINDASQIVLNAANAFYLYDPNSLNGLKTIYIDNEVYWPINLCLNNNGQLAWQFSRPGESVFDTYLYDLSASQSNLQIISQGLPTLFVMNDIGQIIWIDGNTYSLYLTNPGSTNNPQKIAEGGPFCINDNGQIVYLGLGGIYLATPQVEVASFIFPVLGNSITDPLKNKNDPLQDGWTGNGVGASIPSYDLYGHLGQDYYLKVGDSAGKPVYAITKGEVVEVMNGPGKYGWCDDSDHGWGPVVVLKHTSDTGFKVSDNAIIPLGNCGTDRNPKVIYSLYGHLSKDSIKDISVGQTLNTGDLIGVIGKYGVDQASWTTNHLHFEIKDEVGFLEGGWYISHPGQCPGTAAQSCGAQGIGTGYSHLANFAPHRYIPSVFIIENQGRKAHIQGVINLLMSD